MIARLELEPVPTALSRVPAWLEEADREFQLGPEMIFRITLCIEEWFANLLSHAGLGASGKTVVLEITRPAQTVVLTILDFGPSFDPTTATVPQAAQSLDEAQIGGQGLKLIREFCDAWHYVPSSAEGNALTLSFHGRGDL